MRNTTVLKVLLNVWATAFIMFMASSSLSAMEVSQHTGTIHVSSQPESGMDIYLNGAPTGKKTPATLTSLPMGKHKVKLMHPLFRTAEKEVVVGEEPVQVSFQMIDLSADVTINTNLDAIIYLNNQLVGSTQWKGKLAEGTHQIRVEKAGFHIRNQEIFVMRGKEIQVDLMLTSIKGSIHVSTEPQGAMISIDGKMYGLTPKDIDDLPLGTINLSVEKPGFAGLTKRITLTDATRLRLEYTLSSGKEVLISSNIVGAEIYVENELKGQTPLQMWFPYGAHNVRLQYDTESAVETIHVGVGGKTEYSILLSTQSDPFASQLVFVKGGSFQMGDLTGEGNKEERPMHVVTLPDFYISKYEVTQAQWELVMGSNPSHFQGCPTCPVERVSWIDVHEFLAKLNLIAEKKYRLPTEAEWEYAARGGEKTNRFLYAGRNNVNFVAWYSGNSGNKTKPVGTKEPNELGIYDMSGNVWEWVSDWFDEYSKYPQINPRGPDIGDFKVVKGGSWYGSVKSTRVSSRGSDEPVNKRNYVGFRVALSVSD